MTAPGKAVSSGHRVASLVSLLMLGALLLAPSAALAAVSVAKASLSSGSLRVEGNGALANATVSVSSPESTATQRADSKGQFKVSASAYRSSTCKATVSDGSTSVVVTLSSCTPASSPPPPTNPPPTSPPPTSPPPTSPPPSTALVITPDIPELGPGYVGSDFNANASLGASMTLRPDAVGPVDFQIIAGALPAGLSLFDPYGGDTQAKALTRAIVGTPTTVQTSTFTVRATDSTGRTATRTYTIRINPPLTLTITPQAWAPLTAGNFGNLWIDGTGGVRPYKWALTAGAFPTGMSLIQDNPSGPLVRVGGTPTTAGTYTFTLRLTDAQGSTVARTFTVPVG
ncbi:MAG: S-layer domain protein [Solirubrobacterales bacterium]|nr:S-layer domain protein [Solirubrobacterales bacterium]